MNDSLESRKAKALVAGLDMLCEAMQTVTPHSAAEELEARKQDSVYDGADETELPPDDEEWWPLSEQDQAERWREEEEFEFERRAREGYEP